MPKTGFRPEEHGYAFLNLFKLKKGERTAMSQTLTGSVDGAARRLTKDNPLAGLGLGAMLQNTLGGWMDKVLPDHYGMCGGMAFTACDHFRASMPLPRGSDINDIPKEEDPRGRQLREYLWRRQLESFTINAPGLLAWMAMLHLPIPYGGPRWLLDRTREEFAELKGHIDRGEPWPLCLIGSSRSPFDNHQVLATGYEDYGDGRGTVFIYDMNSPGREHTIELDMRGDQLVAVESSPSPARGPLRGFFCETYTPQQPPALHA